MPSFSKQHRVDFSAEKMFELVADVESYPEFLPLCESLDVKSRKEREGRELLVARMGVGYKAIKQHFTSQVLLDRENLRIEVQYLDGPFKRLQNQWWFEPVTESSSIVHFDIDYEFASRTLGMLMGSMFDQAFRRFTAAFEARAQRIYA